MRLRPLAPADLPELVSLCNACHSFDSIQPQVLQEKIFEDPDCSPELSWVLDDGALRGMAVGCWRASLQRGFVKLLCVQPEFQQQGWGSRMLDLLESSLASLGAPLVRVAESAPNYWQPGLDPRYTPALLLFEQRGYQRIGETYNLTCELVGRDFAARSIDLEVRRAQPDDAAQIESFLAVHFSGWRYEVGQMLRNRPISLHLGLRQGQLLGFAGYDGNNRGSGWFGPMGTAPEARGLGLGAELLRRCLHDMQQQGHERCTIPWVGPYGFYARACGARIDRVFYRLEKQLDRPDS